MNHFGKVAVLFGGRSGEREISILSGTAVLDALRRAGVDAHAFDPAERPLHALKDEGFDRVFITIVDTHVSSLISAAFLFQFGTGPIRGFATTLFFGLIANVFTAVFVSRTLFELILSRKPAATAKLSI